MSNPLQYITGSLSGILAHAGHGPVSADHPAHYLTAPEHLGALVAIASCSLGLIWLAIRWGYRISKPT
jgi:hypothetical protein